MINTETNLDACFELPQTYLSELASYCCHLCSLFCPESTLNMRCCKSEIYICFYSVYNWVFLLAKGYFYPILVTAIIFILFLWQQSFLSYCLSSKWNKNATMHLELDSFVTHCLYLVVWMIYGCGKFHILDCWLSSYTVLWLKQVTVMTQFIYCAMFITSDSHAFYLLSPCMLCLFWVLCPNVCSVSNSVF